MKCASCGFENEAGAKFCGKCGSVIAGAPEPPHGGGKAPAVTDGMNIGIIIGTLFIPLLGIIMGAIYMNDPEPAKKAIGKRWLMVGIGVFVAYCVLTLLCAVIGNEMGY